MTTCGIITCPHDNLWHQALALLRHHRLPLGWLDSRAEPVALASSCQTHRMAVKKFAFWQLDARLSILIQNSAQISIYMETAKLFLQTKLLRKR